MDLWTHRAVDALTEAIGGDYTTNSVNLLLVALSPVAHPARMSDSGLQALIPSLRKLTYFRYFRPPDDILVMAARTLLAGGESEQERAVILKIVLDRLGDDDQALLLGRFTR
jgi:hypothetical protein